ncbi:hypothetical protein TZ00_07250 [Agreia bicolorata]|uniref:Uncharacterized protein n=1 Tax=Agreia bicolorata TaxID=110935 RepID=A0ABR5CFL8_9MICO|nr:hypothetical protein TZ00_07250 [Agreia bicolorata]
MSRRPGPLINQSPHSLGVEKYPSEFSVANRLVDLTEDLISSSRVKGSDRNKQSGEKPCLLTEMLDGTRFGPHEMFGQQGGRLVVTLVQGMDESQVSASEGDIRVLRFRRCPPDRLAETRCRGVQLAGKQLADSATEQYGWHDIGHPLGV